MSHDDGFDHHDDGVMTTGGVFARELIHESVERDRAPANRSLVHPGLPEGGAMAGLPPTSERAADCIELVLNDLAGRNIDVSR